MRTLAAKQNVAQYEEWKAEYEADAVKARMRGAHAEAAIYDNQAAVMGKVIADVRYAFEDVEQEASGLVLA